MEDNKAPREVERPNPSGKAGAMAGGIYDNHDASLAGYCKDVIGECAQDYVENTQWRHEGGNVPEDGRLTKAHKNVNFSTKRAQDDVPPGNETFAGDLVSGSAKEEY